MLYPFQLYTDDDPNYTETTSKSQFSNEYPSESYWAKEMSQQPKKKLDQIPYKLYSQDDPFYVEVPKTSPYANEYPNSNYWKKFISLKNIDKNRTKHQVEDIQSFEKRPDFEVGYQILMCLGGDKNPEFMRGYDNYEEPEDDIDRSGIDYVFSEELEKMKPKIERRERNIPYKQDVNIFDCKEEENIDPSFIVLGEKRSDLDYSNFCDQKSLQTLKLKKDLFSTINENSFEHARKKANPYEKIGKAIFMNRAAVKMANIDALFNLTNSSCFDKPSSSDVDQNHSFYFADICAGPGGFTDYLYWRLKRRAFGFGMTLIGDHDWARDYKFRTDISTFKKHYGETGDGNIFRLENLISFQKLIRDNTGGEMVSLVTADGGIAVDGQENDQEMLVKRLVLCQFLCAILILRKGGNFVCKIFDCFTDFTVSLIYVVAQCFERFCVVKPYTSRPANCERYVVFLGLRETNPKSVIKLLSNANEKFQVLEDTRGNDQDIMSLFPSEKIPKDFAEYITKSNKDLLEKQVYGVEELYIYAKGKNIAPLDQDEIANNCCKEWHVPRNNNDENYYRNLRLEKQTHGAEELRTYAKGKDIAPLEQDENANNYYKELHVPRSNNDENYRNQREYRSEIRQKPINRNNVRYDKEDKIIERINKVQKEFHEIDNQSPTLTKLGSIINCYYSQSNHNNELMPVFENQNIPDSPTIFSFI